MRGVIDVAAGEADERVQFCVGDVMISFVLV